MNLAGDDAEGGHVHAVRLVEVHHEHLLRVQGSGFRVHGSEFRVHGSGLRAQGSGFRVQGLRFKV